MATEYDWADMVRQADEDHDEKPVVYIFRDRLFEEGDGVYVAE